MVNRGASRMGIDTAGGVIVSGSPNVITNGCKQARVTDAVAGHGPGEHAGPIMVTGSPTVITNNLRTSRLNDAATCGHLATGSLDVFVGDASFPLVIEIEPGITSVGGAMVFDNTPSGQKAADNFEEAASPKMSEEKLDSPPPPPPETPEGCGGFPDPITAADTVRFVSKYFRLSHCGGLPVAQRGLTANQIACNWQSLCLNLLDPIYEEFHCKINSGWRPVSGGKGGTDHGLGLAADLSTNNVEKNIEMFKWIVRSGLPFTQVIYERFGTSGSGWVHVSYNTAPRGAARTMWTFTGGPPFGHGGANGEKLPPLLA